MTYLEELIQKYELATGNEVSKTSFNLASESSYTSHKAIESLEYDPPLLLWLLF